MGRLVLDLLTKKFHLPRSSQPSVPPASISFRCYWQHHFNFIVLEKAGRQQWEEVVNDVIPSPEWYICKYICKYLYLVGSAFLSYSRWQSFARKSLMFISLSVLFRSALSSVLPGGADSTMCMLYEVTRETEDLVFIQAWLVLLCLSVFPAVANDKDQHSHHKLSSQ